VNVLDTTELDATERAQCNPGGEQCAAHYRCSECGQVIHLGEPILSPGFGTVDLAALHAMTLGDPPKCWECRQPVSESPPVPAASDGWEVSPSGRPHKTFKAARATAVWLSSQRSKQAWEYQAATLEDGTHRVFRRRRR
jgi:hypothetical protein